VASPKCAGRHPSDEVLELYSFGRLPEATVVPTEEHLLTCHDCQDRLADTDAYVSAMKEACRRFVAAAPRPGPVPFMRNLFHLPKPVFAVALTLGVISSVTIPIWNQRGKAGPELDVRLAASRGISQSVPLALANRRLHLTIDVSQVTNFPSYGVSVVRGNGSTVWQESAKPDGNLLSVRLPKPIDAGLYWVRLSSPEAEPIQEYSLRVQ
jgi:hypothetical protein